MSKKNSILIAQLSDTHLLADPSGTMLNYPTRESFYSVVETLKNLDSQPDLLLLTGDLSQDETPQSYQVLQDILHPLAIPSYWIPGNHDNPVIMEQVFQNSAIYADKSLSIGNWQLILLNSRVSGHVEGNLSDDTLNWLDKELVNNREQYTLIAVHHHPVKIDSPWMDDIKLQNSDAFFSIVNNYSQVRLVLFGHIHQEFDEIYQEIRYLGCPSTCVQFKANQENLVFDSLSPGFRLLTLNPDGSFETEVKRSSFKLS